MTWSSKITTYLLSIFWTTLLLSKCFLPILFSFSSKRGSFVKARTWVLFGWRGMEVPGSLLVLLRGYSIHLFILGLTCRPRLHSHLSHCTQDGPVVAIHDNPIFIKLPAPLKAPWNPLLVPLTGVFSNGWVAAQVLSALCPPWSVISSAYY